MSSLNSGDVFILIHKNELFHFVGLEANVHEKAKVRIEIFFDCNIRIFKRKVSFGFGLKFYFGGLNQNSAYYVICEINIYIDSESFRQIH